MPLEFRPATHDASIWHSVAGLNEYAVDPFPPDSIVIDIGAHIGSFTYLALDRGAKFVLAVEPDDENARLWQHNIHGACRATDRAVLLTAACWPWNGPVMMSRTGPNTGGTHVGPEGHPVAAVSLDAVISLALAFRISKRIAMLKLDCEGSEWPLLLSSQKLGLIDEIIGEYHLGDGGKEIASLSNHLESQGFKWRSHATSEGLGLFRASNPKSQ